MLAIDDQFRAFVTRHATASFPRSQWISDGVMQVYVRTGPRYVKGEMRRGITIANVEVVAAEQRRGHFSRFLAQVEDHVRTHDLGFLFVEGVLNPALANHLTKRGYERLPMIGAPEVLGDYVKLI